MTSKQLFLMAIITVAITGCAWVKPTPGGEKVRVLEATEVTTCKRLGETTVSLLARVAGVDRNTEKVQQELNTLARNSAAEMGGDTVVPVSEAFEGKQTFAVYKCVGVNAPL